VERWRGRGLEVAYLPRYSPHLNPVETIWRRVKGFLMPRRHYRSVEELRGAVVAAMERLREQLGHGVLQSLCIGT
jgi:putative transposase